jgi:hypothetical protein
MLLVLVFWCWLRERLLLREKVFRLLVYCFVFLVVPVLAVAGGVVRRRRRLLVVWLFATPLR